LYRVRVWRSEFPGEDRLIPAKMAQTVVCPICHGNLRFNADFTRLRCTGCQRHYRVQDEIPVLLPPQALDEKE